MKVNWKDDIPYIMENIKNDPNHQPDDITILEVHHGPLVHHIYVYTYVYMTYCLQNGPNHQCVQNIFSQVFFPPFLEGGNAGLQEWKARPEVTEGLKLWTSEKNGTIEHSTIGFWGTQLYIQGGAP